ncbi:MAG: DUF192 domain-containing protein [Chloroflexi bacterium]|nr:DUF192 domain-containing protein [Chloroflexota bacterium]
MQTLLIALALLILVACTDSTAATPQHTATVPPTTATARPSPTANPKAPTAIINGYAFRLEVAETGAEHARGLMDRPSLPLDEAMLFVFGKEDTYAFWMKNTLIALDILWLGSDGRIVDIQTMYPEPGKPDQELRIYVPAAKARYAIEMNAGLAERYGFKSGMQVELSLIEPIAPS